MKGLNYQIIRFEKSQFQNVNCTKKSHIYFCVFSCSDAPSDRESYLCVWTFLLYKRLSSSFSLQQKRWTVFCALVLSFKKLDLFQWRFFQIVKIKRICRIYQKASPKIRIGVWRGKTCFFKNLTNPRLSYER